MEFEHNGEGLACPTITTSDSSKMFSERHPKSAADAEFLRGLRVFRQTIDA